MKKGKHIKDGSLYKDCIFRIKLDWLSRFWPKANGFSWNPIKGRWHELLFYETYNDANYMTGALWTIVKINNHLFLRIQTNA